MTDDLEGRIDELYGLPLERFTPERDALARRLASEGDREAAGRIKALRKPVAAAWALNALSREAPEGIAELEELGRRLREAHRLAVSGGDADAFRQATEERRALVARLTARARGILERAGSGGASAEDDITATLDAAVVDEAAAAGLRAGRLVRPMRPPSAFGEAPALTVLPGGATEPPSERVRPAEDPRAKAGLVRELRREVGAAEARQRRAEAAVARAQSLLQDAERRRSEAKDGLRQAETERRGAVLEVKRLAAALSKLEGAS